MDCSLYRMAQQPLSLTRPIKHAGLIGGRDPGAEWLRGNVLPVYTVSTLLQRACK